MTQFAVVGAGFSGTLVAVHLLRSHAPAGARVALIERRGEFGPGTAYSTHCDSHVLNVPAGRMSAFDALPDDFVAFARTLEPSIGGGSFVRRAHFGRYVESLLADAEREGALRGVALERRTDEATAVRQRASGGLRVELRASPAIDADRVVLALGNLAPSDPLGAAGALHACPFYVSDPWAAGVPRIAPGVPIALIGTGLTMMDVALALDAAGHRGSMLAISRRGLLPQAHRASASPPRAHPRPHDLETWPASALGLLRRIRREVRDAGDRGTDWREVVTALRDDTPWLWSRLGEREHRRFLEHLRPYWEVHRHRAAPEPARRIAELRASGRIVVIAGRVTGYRANAPASAGKRSSEVALRLVLRRRGALRDEEMDVGAVVNCTGPSTDVAHADHALLAQLVGEGLVRGDRNRLGIDSDETGAALARCGTPSTELFVIGPLRKGSLWENTAVPELRREAAMLAARLGSGAGARSASSQRETAR